VTAIAGKDEVKRDEERRFRLTGSNIIDENIGCRATWLKEEIAVRYFMVVILNMIQ
jgi:hypothetical protein